MIIRNTTLAALCALALAACNEKVEPAVPAPPETPVEVAGTNGTEAPTPPEAPAATEPSATVEETDFSYSYKSDAYILTASVGPELQAFDAALARALMLEARGELEAFKLSSADMRDQATRPFEAEISINAVAVNGDLASVETGNYTESGGAHPYAWADARIYRQGELEPVPIARFISNTDNLKQMVIDALVLEKIERGFSPDERDMIVGELSDALAGDDTWMTNISFVASDAAGKFGGLQALFSPYEIGSYAEGSYGPVIPAKALAPILKPDAKPLFGGKPVGVSE